MNITITDRAGQSVGKALSDLLQKPLYAIRNSGRAIQQGILWCIRGHFNTIYPDSQHYSPDRVTAGEINQAGDFTSASVTVDVPGITRAYRDITIRPVNRNALTIPVHKDAYGKKASDIEGLFKVTTRKGKSFLAKQHGDGIVMMYFLAKSAFQRQDRRLMPSDQELADNAFSRVKAALMNRS